MGDDRLTFHSDREDGRFVDIEGFMNHHLRNRQPRLEFDPSLPVEQIPRWQAMVAEKLRELLAFPEDTAGEPEPVMLWAEARDGYELQKWEAYPEPMKVVPFLVLVPEGVDASNPGATVMCFPGSWHTKEMLAKEPEVRPWVGANRFPESNCMARHYAKAGLVAVAVDHPDMGERTTNCFGGSRYAWCVHAIWTGRSFEGVSVFEKMVILKWLKQCQWVDSSRIAVSGHSLGAKPALHMGVLDSSIAAVVWNDFLAHWREREVYMSAFRPHLGHYIPGMQQWFDYLDLVAAVAPRPLLVAEGGRTADIEKARRAWHLTGSPENFAVTYYPIYATADKRPHDHDELFDGMTEEEYFAYANVDAGRHHFKENVAVPWLARTLNVSRG